MAKKIIEKRSCNGGKNALSFVRWVIHPTKKNQPMKNITVNQLREVLSRVSSACPVGFSAFVSARARKTGNPFADVAKLSKVSAFTGIVWENSVNRQLGREGKEESFQESARSWGERISPALVQKEGKFYLVAKVEKTAKPVYLAKRASGQAWQVVAKETVAAFLPTPRAANTGTEKELVYRNYSLENITRISIGGETYRVRA